MPKQPYASLDLSEQSRRTLITAFPPKYPCVTLNHITIEYGTDDAAALFEPDTIEVIGYIDDCRGIEALLLLVDGQCFREDGNPWHITISFDKDCAAPKELDPDYDAAPEDSSDKPKRRPYAAVMSNTLIRLGLNSEIQDYTVQYLVTPIKITATPIIHLPAIDAEQTPDPLGLG